MKTFVLFLFMQFYFCLSIVCTAESSVNVGKLAAAGFSPQEIERIIAKKTTAKEIYWESKMRALGRSEQDIKRVKRVIFDYKNKLALNDKSIKNGQLFMPIIRVACDYYGIEIALLVAIIKVESDFNPLAVSSKGALGLMQLMPETAKMMGVRNVFDPAQNIYGGTRYLAMQLQQFGRVELALAAYCAGPNRVDGKTIPKAKEIREYIKMVLYHKNKYKYI